MICEGEYHMDRQWDTSLNPLDPTLRLISMQLILFNIFLSFQTYFQRRQIELGEKLHGSQFNRGIPKSLEGMFINIFTVIIISSLTVCKQILQRFVK